MEQTSIWARLRATPCLLAILGLAFLNTAREAYRYPLLLHVESAGLISIDLGFTQISLASLITLAGLALLAVLCFRWRSHIVFHPMILFCAALMMTLGYFGKFDFAGSASAYGVLQVLAEFTQLAGFFLLAGWAHTLFRHEGIFALAIAASSYVLSGVAQAAVLLIRPEAGIVVCSMASILSVMLLFVYSSRVSNHTMLPGVLHLAFYAPPAPTRGRETSLSEPAKTSLRKPWRFAACFFVYGALGYYQFANWQAAQAMSTGPLMIQGFGSVGTLLAGAVLLCVLAKSRYPSNEFVYRAVLLLVLVVSAFVSATSSGFAFASAFTVFVDMAYKLTMFYTWLIAFTHFREGKRTAAFLLLFFIQQLGALGCALTEPVAAFRFALIVLSLLYLVIDFAMSLLSKERPLAVEDEFAAERMLEEQRRQFEDERAKMEVYKQLLFSLYLMDTYGLTQRECEVLDELVLEKTTREIAETLVVSLDTVKTHRRNIYQKMHVASAAELRETCNHLRESEFPAFLQSIVAENRS